MRIGSTAMETDGMVECQCAIGQTLIVKMWTPVTMLSTLPSAT
jgi:hypothetical protein